LRDQKFGYKIRYKSVYFLFLLPKSDEVHMAFMIVLDKPIQLGQQRYHFFWCCKCPRQTNEVVVKVEKEELHEVYGGRL
jgi:Histone chaperone Rttp106-like